VGLAPLDTPATA